MADTTSKQRQTYTTESIRNDTDRAVFLGNAVLDNMFSSLTALTTEMWSVRRRLNVVEGLLAQHGTLTAEMIEKYVPSASESARWTAERDAFVRLVFEPMTRRSDVPFSSSRSSE